MVYATIPDCARESFALFDVIVDCLSEARWFSAGCCMHAIGFWCHGHARHHPGGNGPDRGLGSIIGPMGQGAVADHVPARSVLPSVVAAN